MSPRTVRLRPGMPFAFPSESAFAFAGIAASEHLRRLSSWTPNYRRPECPERGRRGRFAEPLACLRRGVLEIEGPTQAWSCLFPGANFRLPQHQQQDSED